MRILSPDFQTLNSPVVGNTPAIKSGGSVYNMAEPTEHTTNGCTSGSPDANFPAVARATKAVSLWWLVLRPLLAVQRAALLAQVAGG